MSNSRFFLIFLTADVLQQMCYTFFMKVQCPICKKVVFYKKDQAGQCPSCLPFCCERCKLIDLGRWLDADYRIPAKPDESENGQTEEDV
jgi:uncharacterized protein